MPTLTIEHVEDEGGRRVYLLDAPRRRRTEAEIAALRAEAARQGWRDLPEDADEETAADYWKNVSPGAVRAWMRAESLASEIEDDRALRDTCPVRSVTFTIPVPPYREKIGVLRDARLAIEAFPPDAPPSEAERLMITADLCFEALRERITVSVHPPSSVEPECDLDALPMEESEPLVEACYRAFFPSISEEMALFTMGLRRA